MDSALILDSLERFRQIKVIEPESVYLLQNIDNEGKYVQKKINKIINKDDILNNGMIIKNHPSILQILGFYFSKANKENEEIENSIITEYMKNGSLQDLYEEKNTDLINELTDTKKFIILLGIAYGILHLHLNEYDDFSLQPKKILLDDNCFPYICLNVFSQKKYIFNEKRQLRKRKMKEFSKIVYNFYANEKIKDDELLDFSSIENEWLRSFILKYYTIDESFLYIDLIDELINNKNQFGNIDEIEVDNYIKMIKQYQISYVKSIKAKAEENDYF